jgi:hypothetical protein
LGLAAVAGAAAAVVVEMGLAGADAALPAGAGCAQQPVANSKGAKARRA